ncbi:hypothetical protein D3C71_631790 [compost metagenome]
MEHFEYSFIQVGLIGNADYGVVHNRNDSCCGSYLLCYNTVSQGHVGDIANDMLLIFDERTAHFMLSHGSCNLINRRIGCTSNNILIYNMFDFTGIELIRCKIAFLKGGW